MTTLQAIQPRVSGTEPVEPAVQFDDRQYPLHGRNGVPMRYCCEIDPTRGDIKPSRST